MCAQSDHDHHCSVLLIEDEPGLRDVLRVALEADGYQVAVAASGREALTHLRSTPATCIIVLDLTRAAMSGRRFRELQLRDRSLAWIPLVVVSGALDASREAHDLGAKAFARGPLDVDALRGAVSRAGCRLARPDDHQLRTRGAAHERRSAL